MADRFSSDDFGLKLYNRFPPSYREIDKDNKYALKRYMQAVGDGGFKYVIEEQNGLLDLINPQTCSVEVLYLLYEQYGLELFHGIPEDFLRAFLPNLGQAWAKKGSLDVIEFIVSSLTGIKTETEVSYDEFENPLVTVKLEMDFAVTDYFPDSEQFERILESFIPFYCDALLVYSYVYYENADLAVREQFEDKWKDVRDECIHIPFAKGTRPLEVLNHVDKQLGWVNSNALVLNGTITIADDPDILVKDTIMWRYDESGKIDSVFSHDQFRPMLNMEDKEICLNNGIVLSRPVEVDEYEEHVKVAPLADDTDLSGIDTNKDTLKVAPVEDDARFGSPVHFLLNTSLLNGEMTLGKLLIDEYEDKFIYSYSESGRADKSRSSEYLLPLLNTGLLLNSMVLNDNIDTDNVSESVSFAPVIDSGVARMADSEVSTELSMLAENEGASLFSMGVQDLLNDGLTNELQTAYSENVDKYVDNVHISHTNEDMRVKDTTALSAFLNMTPLNSGFVTNGFSVCDIITWNTGEKAVQYA